MGDWLVLLIVVLVAPVALLGGAAAVAATSLRRANRLLPGRGAGGAPLRWLWSPGAAAVLHRRLRYVCQLVSPLSMSARTGPRWRRHRQPPEDGISRLAGDVLHEAMALDRELVAANFMARGLPRAHALADLEAQVRELELSARRVRQLSARRAGLARPGGPSELSLDQRIAAMEEALAELAGGPGPADSLPHPDPRR